jgi:hypothetical protein
MAVKSGLEKAQEEATEDPREHAHGQEEARSTGHPTRAVGSNPSTRDHTMEVRVIEERLAPGV